MLYLPDNKGMDNLSTFWQELIVSITPGMAGIGSLVAGETSLHKDPRSGRASDLYGRRAVILLASLFFTVGAVVCASALERWTLVIGRIIFGIAVG